MNTNRILVIGYGNSIRGDDAAGWQAAVTLAREDDISRDPRVDITPTAQLSPELAADLARTDEAIFVDASCEGTPGEINVNSLEDSSIPLGEMPHALTPSDLAGLTRQIYDWTGRSTLVTITGRSFGFQQKLSPPVEAAFPELLQTIRKRVTQALSTDTSASAG